MTPEKRVNVGIIGGGLMGREVASAFGRWFALKNMPVEPHLTGVADVNQSALDWFEALPDIQILTRDYHELLALDEIEVIYVAVPHQLHEEIYLDVLDAGKDLMAEKPFGIDLDSAQRIIDAISQSNSFVRVSSEFPFFPGAQRVFRTVENGELGRIIEVTAGFHHASDLNPRKPINWKRQVKTCGEIGVMGDLGLHVVHLPFRMNMLPQTVYAQLQQIVTDRPDGRGGMASCDTWDNATLHTTAHRGEEQFPMRLETKRIAPGETNTWFIRVVGMDGSVSFSTKEPKTLWAFTRDEDQWWQKTDLGFGMEFPAITGGIFEVGFPDIIMQMWAAYLLEREGNLGDRFGCATPDEALRSQELFAAALTSQKNQDVVPLF